MLFDNFIEKTYIIICHYLNAEIYKIENEQRIEKINNAKADSFKVLTNPKTSSKIEREREHTYCQDQE